MARPRSASNHFDRANLRHMHRVRAQIAIILILLAVAGGAVLVVGRPQTPAETRDAAELSFLLSAICDAKQCRHRKD